MTEKEERSGDNKIKFFRHWYTVFPQFDDIEFLETCLVHVYANTEIRAQVEVSPIQALGVISKAFDSKVFENANGCWEGDCPNTANCPVWGKLSKILRDEILFIKLVQESLK